jgi:ATP-dependent Lhr-like helicase
MARIAVAELEFLHYPPSSDAALATLGDPIRRWFTDNLGQPTTAQRLAWPAIAAGKNVLLSAPTGSGKTLAAFLPIVDRIIADRAIPGIRCLYVSPMKALATDIRRSLRIHLRKIEALVPGRRIRVGLRTGDTPARVRRKQLLHPPDILLTTPESLAVLLSRASAANLFRSLFVVVIDEVHSLAGDKRGADLSLSLERLAQPSEHHVQRIGLSATCAPLEEAARFLVGVDRPCSIAHAVDASPLRIDVELLRPDGKFFSRLLERLIPELMRNRSTLIFTNTRRLAERLAFALRRRCPDWDASIAVHHSALAAERRRYVERLFKRGRLRAVVSSTSLELGIDIGPVDSVVLVHPPGGVVRLLQRVGRAGHAPGRLRRGLVLTAGPSALFEAAVTAASSHASQCEPLRVPAHPLDVLSQQLLGMAAAQAWQADETYQLVKRAYPYRNLGRAEFYACVRYLSGGDGLPVRLRAVDGKWAIRGAAIAALLRRNVGSIIAEETRPVVSGAGIGNGSLIGEVDAGFGESLQAGDRFLLDGRCLEFRRRDAGSLIVDEVPGRPAAPHWGGEGWPLAQELARRLYLFRVQAAEALRDGREAFMSLLQREFKLGSREVCSLANFIERQECISEVPHVRTLLIECVRRDHGIEYYFHTPLNRTGNDALARVAVLRLARDFGRSSLSLVSELGFMLMVRGERPIEAASWRDLLSVDKFNDDLTAALLGSELLKDRFRQVAQTSLLWPRNPVGAERRACISTADADFVLVRQALRELLSDRVSAQQFLEQLLRMTIHCRQLAEISPFVEGWNRVEAGAIETVNDTSPTQERRVLAGASG